MKIYSQKFIYFSLLLVTALGCDSEDPAFIMEETTPSADQSVSDDVSGTSVTNSGEAGGQDAINVIKNNGDNLPDSIVDKDTGDVKENYIEAEYSSEHKLNEIGEGEMKVSLDNLVKETVITHDTTTETKSIPKTQVIRNSKEDHFPQGYPSSAQMESINQGTTSGVLDLLIVIDDSGSMDVEQANVAANLPALLSYVSNSDWRIMVVTTYNGRVSGLISKGDVDLNGNNNEAARFATAINVGANNHGNEKGIQYAREGLDKTLTNGTSWIRPNSTLAILIISDEDNCSSNGSGCGSSPWAVSSYLTNHIATIRPPENPVRVHGIYWDPNTPHASCSTGTYKAIQYKEAVDLTNGSWGSICSNDYSTVLTGISAALKADLKSQFTLLHPPIANPPLTVAVEDASGNPILDNAGNVQVFPFSVAGTTLTFTTIYPPKDSVIKVAYNYGGMPIVDKFPLSAKPALDAPFAVSWVTNVSGTSVITAKAPGAYDVIEEQPTPGVFKSYVKFKTGHIPPASSTVRINYKEYKELIKHVEISCDYKTKEDPASVMVYVDTVLLPGNQYTVDFAGKKVAFNKGFIPADGSAIKVDYTCFNQVYSYSYQAIATAVDLYVYNVATKAKVEVTFSNNTITFAKGQYVEGAKFAVRNLLDFNIALAGAIELTNFPILETIVVKSATEECQYTDITVTDRMIDVSECGFTFIQSDLMISFDYVKKSKLTYVVDEKFFTAPHKTQVWTITIDDDLTSDYTINGNTLTLNASAFTEEAKGLKINVKLINE